MNSTSFQVFSIQDLENEILNTKNHFEPTLAILFGSVDCDLSSIPAVFNKYNIDVIGCSSSGEICDVYVYEKGITGLFMDINTSSYQIYDEGNTHNDSLETGIKLAKEGKEFCEYPSFLTFFGMTTNAEEVIIGIKSIVAKKCNIFGGMAGDDFKMEKTYSFSNNGIVENGVVALIFDQDKVEMNGRALCGWESIGTTNIITKAEGNIIYTINNQPALQAFENYFGSFHGNDEEVETLSIGVAQYPLQIERGKGTVLRAALKVDEKDQSIMMAGPIETGDQFKFSVAPGFEIIEETINGFKEYSNTNSSTDALVLISCKARHMSLGPMVEEEIKGIQNLWNKPLIGFFSYGEVGMSELDECNFYNETCSLVLIREK